MKKITSILIGLLMTTACAAAPFKTQQDAMIHGRAASSLPKYIAFDVGSGGNNPRLSVNPTTLVMAVTTNAMALGNGMAGIKNFSFDVGSGASNPLFRWDGTKLQFSNNGSSFTDLGANTTTLYAARASHGDDCYLTTGSGSFVAPTGDASCTFSVGYNSNFGSITSVLDGGNNTSGITFTAPVTGIYQVCAGTFTRNTGGVVFGRLYDGTNVLASAGQNTTGAFVPMSMCGITTFTASASVSITLQMKISGGTGEFGNTVTGSGTTVDWSIFVIN